MAHTQQGDLDDERDNPDADEQRVADKSLEDVAFPVDLACVDLIEQSHHHKRVEDDGEVLCGAGCTQPHPGIPMPHLHPPTVNVKQPLTCNQPQPQLAPTTQPANASLRPSVCLSVCPMWQQKHTHTHV